MTVPTAAAVAASRKRLVDAGRYCDESPASELVEAALAAIDDWLDVLSHDWEDADHPPPLHAAAERAQGMVAVIVVAQLERWLADEIAAIYRQIKAAAAMQGNSAP